MIFATCVLQSLKFKKLRCLCCRISKLAFWLIWIFFYLKNRSVFINSLFEETTSCKYSFQTMACPVIWQSWKHKWKNGGAITMYESNVCFKFYNVHVWCMYMNPCQQWDFPKAKNRANLKWNLVVPWLHLWNMYHMQVLSSCMNNKSQTHKPLQSTTTCQVKLTCYMNSMHARACSKTNASMKEETICTINMTALATHKAPWEY